MSNPLHFTEAWFDLGILTADMLKQLESEYRTSNDKNPEHYRWRAFNEFAKSKRPLDANTAKALYELGNHDPDFQLGGSIMAEILRMEECPDELIEMAFRSNREHLVKIASRKRGEER